MARKSIATKDNTITSAGTEPLSREVARPIFGESVLAIDYNFADKDYLDDDIDFSRASGATQTNSEGKVAFAPHNLLIHSEAFDQWGNAAVATANTHPNPIDGLITADTVGSNGGVKHRTISVTLPQADTYIFSIYLKRKTGSGIIRIGDFTDGTNEVAVTDEWQRFSRTSTLAAGAHTFTLRIDTTDDEVYAWGAQVERRLDGGTTPTDYNKTSGAAYQAPRFDYSADGYGNSKGLLIEEARTQYVTHSIDLNSGLPSKGTGVTFKTASNIVDPSGGTETRKLVQSPASNGNVYQSAFNTIYTHFTEGTTHTRSIYAKKAEMNWIRIQHYDGSNNLGAYFNLETGQVGTVNSGVTAQISDAGNGWYRCSVTRLSPSGVNNAERLQVGLATGDNVSLVYTGDGLSGVYLAFAQLEIGAFPSSFIPSYGASTTVRAADVASVSGTAFSRFFKETEGTIVLDVQMPKGWKDTNYNRFYSFNNGSNTNRITAWSNVASGQEPRGQIVAGGSDQGSIIAKNIKLNTGEVARLGQSYKANSHYVTLDASSGAEDSTVTLPTGLNTLNIGSGYGGVSTLGGWIRRLRYFNKKKSDAQVQKLTDTDKLLQKFKGAKAAHSLRALTDFSESPCVSVRRSYDNSEKSWTPNQVSNGELEADFQSEKQTTLPLDVSVEADEMIVGGDFTDLVTNGDFATDSDWTKGTGWTISGGTATRTDASAYTALAQSILTTGKTYTVTYTVSGASGGGVRARLGGDYIGSYNGNGTHTVSGVCGQYSDFQLMGETNFAGSVDNVSVIEGSWNLGTHFRPSGNRIERFAGGSSENSAFTQTISIRKGRTYKVEYDVTHTSGNNYTNLYINTGNGYITKNQLFGSGHSSETFLALTTGNLLMQFYGIGDFRGFWDNISVKEVNPIATGFSTRKINSSFTGKAMRCRNQGNVEVEVGFDDNNEISLSSPVTNTSQNLLAFSEDFGAWGVQNASVRTSGQSDPNGGQNAWLISGGTAAAGGVTLDVAVTNDKYYTLSGYFKKGTSTKTRLSIHYKYIEWDWSASGVPSLTANSSEPSNITFTPVGTDGWYRISFVWEATATATRTINIDPDRNNTNKTVYAFGAQLEETQYSSTGTELMTNGDFSNGSTGWTLSPFGQTVEVQNEALRIATPDGTFCKAEQVINTTAGKKYTTTANLTVTSGGLSVVFGAQTNHTSSGTISVDRIATGSSYTWTAKRFNTSGANDIIIDDISVKEYDPIVSEYAQTPVISDDGSNTTAATLGEFSGLENLLEYSEAISTNWNQYGWGGSSVNYTTGQTDPNGGTGATKIELINADTSTGGRLITEEFSAIQNQVYVLSVFLKGENGGEQVQIDFRNSSSQGFGGSTVTLTTEWVRYSVVATSDATATRGLQLRHTGTQSDQTYYFFASQANTNSLKTYQKTTGTALTGDVNVVNWYDQAGGEDFTQSTAGEQPRIVMGSELVTDSGGKASVYFDGGDTLDNNTLAGQNRLDSYTIQDTSDTDYVYLSDPDNASRYGLVKQDGSSNSTLSSGFGTPSYYVNGALRSFSNRNDAHDALTGRTNLLSQHNASTGTWTGFTVGHYHNGSSLASSNYTGKISEMVFFPNMDSSPKRFNIEQNMLRHFDVNLYYEDFNDDTGGWVETESGGSNTTLSHETTNPLSGSGSLKIALSNTGTSGGYPRVRKNTGTAFRTGIKYRLSFKAKALSGTGECDVRFGTASTNMYWVTNQTFTTTEQTYTYTDTFDTLPTSGTDAIQFIFDGTKGPFELLIDDVKVEELGVEGYVTKLYDQTGNNCHALQATAAYQPQIVSGGDLIKSGNHPAWEFTNTSPTFHNLELFGKLQVTLLDAWFVADTAATRYLYPADFDDGNNFGWVAEDNSSSTSVIGNYGVNADARLYVNNQLTAQHGVNSRDAISTALVGRKLVHHQNNGTGAWDNVMVGWYGGGQAVGGHRPYFYEGKMSEMIWYDSSQSSDRTSIDTAINTHYNIY